MKTVYNLILVLVATALFGACSSASKDAETQLAELKQQQKEIADKIKRLKVKSSQPTETRS